MVLSIIVFLFMAGAAACRDTGSVQAAEATATFIIFQETVGGTTTVYARNGQTGNIDYSGTDASDVIQDAIFSIPSGGGVKIFIKTGTYACSTSISNYAPDTTSRCLTIEGETQYNTILNFSGATGGIVIRSRRCQVRNISLTGCDTNTAISANTAYQVFDRLYIKDWDYGIDLDGAIGSRISNSILTGIGTMGIKIDTANSCMIDRCAVSAKTAGSGTGLYAYCTENGVTVISTDFSSFEYGALLDATASFTNCSFEGNDIGVYLGKDYNAYGVTIKGGYVSGSRNATRGAIVFDKAFTCITERVYSLNTNASGIGVECTANSKGNIIDKARVTDSTAVVDNGKNHIVTIQNVDVGGTLENEYALDGNIRIKRLMPTCSGCPSVGQSVTTKTITLPYTQPNTSYGVVATPQWGTTVYVTDKTVNGFTLNFGTASPAGGSRVSWMLFTSPY